MQYTNDILSEFSSNESLFQSPGLDPFCNYCPAKVYPWTDDQFWALYFFFFDHQQETPESETLYLRDLFGFGKIHHRIIERWAFPEGTIARTIK